MLQEFHTLKDPAFTQSQKKFYKGEQPRFLGIKVPLIRAFAKKYKEAPLSTCQNLICSRYHEERLLAIFLFVHKYKKGALEEKERVIKMFLEHTVQINHWDLVDQSAPYLLGPYVETHGTALLFELAGRPLWYERRLAIVATLYLIRQGSFKEAFGIASLLLDDPHDLVQKGVGWMIKEASKKDLAAAEAFLLKHYRKMTRMALRYAIEKFPEKRRKELLKLSI